MLIFGYKNISKIIMITTILIILSNTILISVFYYINQLDEFDKNIKILKTKSIQNQKYNLRNNIKNIINMIEYKYENKNIKKHKNEIKLWLKDLPFDKQKSDYIFVYELINKNGGDKFAKFLINPNRKDLIDKYISSKYKDINGFAFREAFLKDINSYGESIVEYTYKKTNDKISKKISYLYYYEPLNWIIAKGVYIDDIQIEIFNKTILLKEKLKKQLKLNIFIFIIILFFAIVITYIIGKKIEKIIKEKDEKVKQKTNALALLNRQLDCKVKNEVEKNKAQEQIIMQKSKFSAIGEMISLIAHQWRQPISEINALMLNMKLHYDMGKINKNIVSVKTNEIENLLEYMSNTIEDFRTFFKPNKQKQNFYFIDSIERTLAITSAMLNDSHIKININIDKTIHILNYQNEFEQVILNIITNAKDALITDNIKNPSISIDIYKKNKIYVKIKDNANGISEDIIDNIFDLYFTTKEQSHGTGIGLYMSKLIIEQNMNGKLNIKSSKSGSCFIISFIDTI